MAYEEKTAVSLPAHSVILDGRERLSVSGVMDVGAFDENIITLTTSRGELIVRGSGLHIEKLNLDTGELSVTGFVTDLSYEEAQPSGGLWSRLFK